jgi:hypothetical protein
MYQLDPDRRILGKFGRAGRFPKELRTVNAIGCRSETELHVGELTNWRGQKLSLHPKQTR